MYANETADLSCRDISRRLTRWYHAQRRDLPWRRSSDPYTVWVSEIMAQQTRIGALLPYFTRFIARFPTIHALAQAREDDVLKAWEGLGYYTRARNLHKAARLLVKDFGGALPDDPALLQGLPGIGAYTAGAIASIAFGRPVPAVDGNVLRVFSRLTASDLDVSMAGAKKQAAAFVARLLSVGEPGVITQSLMELGALVCLPKNPRCAVCPLMDRCAAHHSGRQKDFPVKKAKKAPLHEEHTILVVADERERILVRRRTQALLRGMWEFCVLEGRLGEDAVADWLIRQGLTPETVRPLGAAQHVFTHRVWYMTGFLCCVRSAEAPQDYIWTALSALDSLAFPSALRFYRHVLSQSGIASGLDRA